jgi:hypothetical protein
MNESEIWVNGEGNETESLYVLRWNTETELDGVC